MHYKNGRKASAGDQVLIKDWNGNIQCGVLFDVNPRADQCNAQLQRPLGPPWCVTVGDCVHVDDAYVAVAFSTLSVSEIKPDPATA